MDEQQKTWWSLCHQAWVEEDPVKLLNITMKINQFLSRKQQRVDAEYEEAQRITASY
jgi:hypothetical protein